MCRRTSERSGGFESEHRVRRAIASVPNNIRVYELARELGMTNAETLDLAESLGIGVKSHSSSIVSRWRPRSGHRRADGRDRTGGYGADRS
ncbi:MAG: hypothetical protein EBY49_09410 [Actinobacteria bacterium]|nr:hypothetical protein [Actinomycetota bacterium]